MRLGSVFGPGIIPSQYVDGFAGGGVSCHLLTRGLPYGQKSTAKGQRIAAMTELETAKDRLEKSITRLEAAIKSQAELAAGDDQTAQALAESQRLCSELKDANQTVTNRLDAAIGRLKTVLEG